MKRNKSMLDFQRRLIRTALRSPRAEALKLFGIIYSNLEEFIEVRVPLDDDPDEMMEEFFEVLATFDMALSRKFTNTWLKYEPDAIGPRLIEPNIDTIVDAMNISNYKFSSTDEKLDWLISRIYYFNATEDDGHVLVNSYGVVTNGEVITLAALANYAKDVMRTEPLVLQRIAERADIHSNTGSISAPPHGKISNGEAIDNVRKWLCSEFGKEIRIEFEYNPDLESQFTMGKHDYPNDDHDGIRYIIYYRNAYFLQFNKTASLISAYMKDQTEYQNVFKYDDCGNGVNNVWLPSNGNWPGVIMRGPYIHENPMVTLTRALNLDDWISSKIINDGIKNLDDVTTMLAECPKHQWPKNIVEANMIIYRTGKDLSDINRRFVTIMAALLGPKCHVYVELRARGDEANNLTLVSDLQTLHADVRVVSPKYNTLKVHAKVWSFVLRHYNAGVDYNRVVSVFSTGNFLEAAQNGFADTIAISKVDYDANTNLNLAAPALAMMRDIMSKNYKVPSTDDFDMKTADLIWKPYEIRGTLLDKIRSMTLHASLGDAKHHYFIWIKCNHITDVDIIRALNDAADVGVDVRVIARTTCTIPKNFSEIGVRSITGRYLEHDRMFMFGTYENSWCSVSAEMIQRGEVWISSSDLMPRNLDNRIEFMYKIPQYTFGPAINQALMQLYLDLWNGIPDAHHGFFSFKI